MEENTPHIEDVNTQNTQENIPPVVTTGKSAMSNPQIAGAIVLAGIIIAGAILLKGNVGAPGSSNYTARNNDYTSRRYRCQCVPCRTE